MAKLKLCEFVATWLQIEVERALWKCSTFFVDSNLGQSPKSVRVSSPGARGWFSCSGRQFPERFDSEQTRIFAILESQRIGLSLSEEFMLEPE